MFFLRCAFFLSIVYSSMSWTNASLQPHGTGARVAAAHGVVAAAHADATRLMTRTVAGATDLCTRHATECLADAARLTALFAASDTPTASEDVQADRDAAPRPVPNPRRRAREAKLARAS